MGHEASLGLEVGAPLLLPCPVSPRRCKRLVLELLISFSHNILRVPSIRRAGTTMFHAGEVPMLSLSIVPISLVLAHRRGKVLAITILDGNHIRLDEPSPLAEASLGLCIASPAIGTVLPLPA